MPFDMGAGETTLVIVGVLVGWVLPIAVAVWALVTLSRLRSGQQQLLSRIAALERALTKKA